MTLSLCHILISTFKNVEKIERSRVHSTEVKATARVQYLLPEAKATEVASGKVHA